MKSVFGLAAAGVAMLVAVAGYWVAARKKRSGINKLYQQAMNQEGEGNDASAIELYQQYLTHIQQAALKDAFLIRQVKGRIKTIQSKLDYEEGFVPRKPVSNES